jgi:hypothetical protein
MKKRNKHFVGTIPFASIGAHEGFGNTPKDDICSLIYVLVFIATGNLPWIAPVQSITDPKARIMSTYVLKKKADHG